MIFLKNNKKELIQIFFILIYRFLLDYAYIIILAPIFSYSGFVNEATNISFIISYIVLFFYSLLVVKHLRSNRIILSNSILIFFLVCFVPLTSLMAFVPMELPLLLMILLYWFLLLFFSIIVKPTTIIKINSKYKSVVFFTIMLILCVAVIYVSGVYTGFRFHFNLTDVYNLRDEEREMNFPTIFGYLLPSASGLLPVFFMYFMYKKKWIFVFILSLIIFLNFSIGGHKSVIFMLFLCFIGYHFYSAEKIAWYVNFMIGIVLIGIAEWKIYGTFVILSMIVRRVLYLPGLLNYHYYDFFSKNEFDMFRQSFLRHFGAKSPYDIPIPKVIGLNYYNNYDTNANNGLFSDAYYNFGLLGVIIFPVILIFIINFIDSISKNIDSKYLLLPVIAIFSAFASGSFMSALLTNGILLLIFLLIFFPTKTANIKYHE